MTSSGLERFLASEREKRKPSTHRMLATGVALRGDPSEWTTRCAEVLAGGPEPLSESERDRLRYVLTDSLDERAVIALPFT
ncbi:hypothetical protein JIG36_45615 [Actinoplanes sp. LDG1-06]|uniref:Uncharacterized protein n=1 Tax=Paractinoplanes ovalisporus TaxID=2810368 RepID=A0ABS2ASV3_9ACTN|nr:hypothetical protein [Actinoplanes ovalisporus]MBM2622803.1 hypothetical protein [Actinoplanes ovalisporus]